MFSFVVLFSYCSLRNPSIIHSSSSFSSSSSSLSGVTLQDPEEVLWVLCAPSKCPMSWVSLQFFSSLTCSVLFSLVWFQAPSNYCFIFSHFPSSRVKTSTMFCHGVFFLHVSPPHRKTPRRGLTFLFFLKRTFYFQWFTYTSLFLFF